MRSASRTATSPSPACASSRRRSPRSTPRRGGVRPTRGRYEADVLGRRARRRLRPRRDARARRGGQRVLLGRRRASGSASCCPRSRAGRAIVGVCGAPFKCPPAPSEAALLLHDYLSARGVRERLRDLVRDPVRHAGPAVARRRRRRSSARSPSAASTFVPGRRVSSLDGAAASPFSTTAASCRSTSSSACPSTGRRTWSSRAAWPRTATSR